MDTNTLFAMALGLQSPWRRRKGFRMGMFLIDHGFDTEKPVFVDQGG
jgi:hypothetical protein